jgi:hypothetical protein
MTKVVRGQRPPEVRLFANGTHNSRGLESVNARKKKALRRAIAEKPYRFRRHNQEVTSSTL